VPCLSSRSTASAWRRFKSVLRRCGDMAQSVGTSMQARHKEPCFRTSVCVQRITSMHFLRWTTGFPPRQARFRPAHSGTRGVTRPVPTQQAQRTEIRGRRGGRGHGSPARGGVRLSDRDGPVHPLRAAG
jgi:hypothetical protein